jgi:hypothetical protein
MYDPVPRSHMFMIDARRMSGSGCCSSTQRAQEPPRQLRPEQDPTTNADLFWYTYISRHYPNLMRIRLRSYRNHSYFPNILQAERRAVHEWHQIYRERAGTWTDAAMNAEIDRIAQSLQTTITSLLSNNSFNI